MWATLEIKLFKFVRLQKFAFDSEEGKFKEMRREGDREKKKPFFCVS